MFSHKNKAERTASQAWDYLASAMATAGESAKEAGKHTADLAGGKAAEFGGKAAEFGGKAAGFAGKANRKSQKLAAKAGKKSHKLAGKASKRGDEAWARAHLAAAALAGRKPRRPWGLIIGIGLLGAAAGWAAASSARAALERQAENEELELAETAVVVTPTFDR